MTNLLLINSGKKEAYSELLQAAPTSHIRVITEPAYQKYYGEETAVHLVDDIGDLTSMRALILELNESNKIDFIVGPSERSIPVAGYIRSLLGLPGHSFDVANRFSNKGAMKQALMEKGIAIAPFRFASGIDGVARAAAELGYPVIVKPAYGTGSMNAFCFWSEAEAREVFTTESQLQQVVSTTPLIVERLLELQGEFTCDGVIADRQVIFSGLSRYHGPLLENFSSAIGATTMMDDDPRAATIRQLHDEVVSALELESGVTHMECFETENGFVVGEIAARPGGGGVAENVRDAYGVDLWDAFMRDSLGAHPLPSFTYESPRARTAWLGLPQRPGTVTKITQEDSYVEIPGVSRVRNLVHVGDRISTRIHSSSDATEVFISVALNEPELLRRALVEAQRVFVLEVCP